METDPLHPGDVCLIIEDMHGRFPETVGLECEILEEEGVHVCRLANSKLTSIKGYVGHIQGEKRVLVFERRELKKRRPPAPELERVRKFVRDTDIAVKAKRVRKALEC
jgi:hypothetical protein